ncbi:MAG: hypothetical protein ACPGF7_03255 [Pontibacterium sp.]
MQKLRDIEPGSILSGVPQEPSAPLSTTSHRQRTLYLLRRHKTNQIIKTLKRHTPELIKQIKLLPEPRLSRADRTGRMVCALYISSDTRQSLIIKEWALQTENPRSTPYLPILEYEALRDWFPDFKPPCLRAVNEDIQAALRTVNAEPFRNNHITASQHSLAPQLHVEAVLRPGKSNGWSGDPAVQWPVYQLATYGDRLLIDLGKWATYKDAERLRLVTAIYAYCVTIFSPESLIMYLSVQPEIAPYLNGVALMTKADDGIFNPKDDYLTAIDWQHPADLVPKPTLPTLVTLLNQIKHYCDTCYDDPTIVHQMAETIHELEVETHKNRTQAFRVMDIWLNNYLESGQLDGFVTQLNDLTLTNPLDGVVTTITRWIEFAQLSQQHQLVEYIEEAGNSLTLLQTSLEQLPTLVQSLQDAVTGYLIALEDSLEQPLLDRPAMLRPFEDKNNSALQALTEHVETAYPEIPDIQPLIKARQHKPDPESLSEEEKLRIKIEALKAELRTAKHDKEALIHENDQLNLENDSLRQESNILGQNLTSAKLQMSNGNFSNTEDHSDLSEQIQTLVCKGIDAPRVLHILETLHSDRLRILPSAYQSAADTAIPTSALFERTQLLVTDGLDALRTGSRMIDINDLIPGEIAVQESQTVRNCDKLTRHRIFKDNGQDRTIFTHLALDYSTRMYFEYDTEESRIIIGYVGKHLPSAKSATV